MTPSGMGVITRDLRIDKADRVLYDVKCIMLYNWHADIDPVSPLDATG